MATRNSAALFNMSYFGKFFLRGPDADAAIEWIFTNSVAGCPVGKTVYTCMLNNKAGIEADLTVSVLSGDNQVLLSQIKVPNTRGGGRYEIISFRWLVNSFPPMSETKS